MAKEKKEKEEEGEKKKPVSLLELRKGGQSGVLGAILAKYGKGAISAANDPKFSTARRISSGVFVLDYALNGGWPRGRINTIWGARSASKTTLMCKMIADCQKRCSLTNEYIWKLKDPSQAVPFNITYVDVEGAFDTQWAKKLGVNVDDANFTISRPTSAEEAGNIIQALLKSGTNDVIVLDSLAVMLPTDEGEAAQEKWQQGLAARLNGKMFRKIQSALNELHKMEDGKLTPTVFVINQERLKIGVMFGDPSTKPGGMAQDFFASVEVKVWGNSIEYYDGDEKKLPKCATFGFNVAKNKVGPPKIKGEYTMAVVDDHEGKFKVGEVLDDSVVLDFARRLNVLVEEGKDANKKWFMYGHEFKRKKDLIAEYVDNPQNYTALKVDLLQKMCPYQ